MPKREDIHKVLIIGSGPIIIGQACEFDYSGTQACKALKKLGYEIVLVNSNPATIMTDPETADVTYIEPLNVERLEQIIAKERPDALLPNLGGQSGLNLSSELYKAGVLDKYNVKVGDTVSLYDKYADKNFTFTVAGEYPYEASLAVFMNLAEFNGMFEKTPDYYTGYFSDSELTELSAANVYMRLDSATFGSFADQLWKAFADFMGPVKWFGILMFVLMVYLLAKQIIERNQTSISMTKILGFTGGEIGGLYIVSTSIVVVGSLLLAVPLVDWLLRLVFKNYLYQRISGDLPYCISNDCYWKMLLLGSASYVIVVVMQLFKIHRIPKSDALKILE